VLSQLFPTSQHTFTPPPPTSGQQWREQQSLSWVQPENAPLQVWHRPLRQKVAAPGMPPKQQSVSVVHVPPLVVPQQMVPLQISPAQHEAAPRQGCPLMMHGSQLPCGQVC
jgi:hypothetical protein